MGRDARVTNPHIRIDGDEATGSWYLLDCITHEKFKWSEDIGHVTPENPMRILRRSGRQD